ncbi:hypothetical protein TPHA_0L01390 [Tetrapisispora phaffii CBS 4417]|uniref:Pre-mRNA-splicing factor CWC21 n=1 Tax=Tetrapisispora phaffii (strain ATCC 24235 / CBS 4417 / NBRC 1672 / NRRL Y-8282 / UCD 70-5) TaxID=1071381 RepID=G8C016_TETPH|nr:hypothetical protein TPHA_0L01390 [Tetrapisispora phaffii CBS 4417]CCE65494.1 hypothetical protein TPHA_0L01390 [Tetrapisispora phaffii CBS 4417]
MSYNGIGLKSAKGSSTSGHVQSSLAHNSRANNKNYLVRKQATALKKTVTPIKKKHISMLEHSKKRQALLETEHYKQSLIAHNKSTGKDPDMDEIEQKCKVYKQKLLDAHEPITYTSRIDRDQDASTKESK